MPGVGREFLRIPPTERHDQGSPERQGDALERIEVRVGDAALDPTLDHPAESGPSGEHRSRQPAPLTQSLDFRPDPGPQFPAETIGLDRQLRSSDPRHDRYMFIRGASPPLTSLMS